MIRRWSYITHEHSVFARNIVTPAAAKMFKASLKIKTISKSQTRLMRKKYFFRKIKNSLTMLSVLASNWALGVIALKKNLMSQHHLDSVYLTRNTGLCVMNVSNLRLRIKSIFYYNLSFFPTKKALLQPGASIVFPTAKKVTCKMSMYYRRVLTILVLSSLLRPAL
jgi:hypothetical protein